MRSGARPFTLQGFHRRTRASRRRFCAPRRTVAASVGTFGALSRSHRCRAFRRRLEVHASSPGFGKTYRNGLLRRSRAMLARANVLHLLVYELARLGTRRFTGASITPRTLEGLLLRHRLSPQRPMWASQGATLAISDLQICPQYTDSPVDGVLPLSREHRPAPRPGIAKRAASASLLSAKCGPFGARSTPHSPPWVIRPG